MIAADKKNHEQGYQLFFFLLDKGANLHFKKVKADRSSEKSVFDFVFHPPRNRLIGKELLKRNLFPPLNLCYLYDVVKFMVEYDPALIVYKYHKNHLTNLIAFAKDKSLEEHSTSYRLFEKQIKDNVIGNGRANKIEHEILSMLEYIKKLNLN